MSAAALIDALATMTQDEAAEIEMAQRRHAASIDAALSRHADWPATIRHEILHNRALAALPAAVHAHHHPIGAGAGQFAIWDLFCGYFYLFWC